MLLAARVLILLLALIEVGLAAWYVAYWDRVPHTSRKRRATWLTFCASAIVIPLVQALIFKSTAPERLVPDPFVLLVIGGESLVSAALLIYLAVGRRIRKVADNDI